MNMSAGANCGLPESIENMNLAACSRRKFLKVAAGTVASLAIPALANQPDFWSRPRELWLHRPSTGETVRAIYFANGAIVPDGYIKICKLLRDTHRDLAVQFDLVTLDIARGVQGWLEGNRMNRPIIVNSGYRHPLTNATEGGVFNSYHTKAMALDIRIDGVSSASVGRFAQYLSGGGVGFYPGKEFTHLDRGRVRSWNG